MLILGNLKDTEMSKLPENTTEPLPLSDFDSSVNIEAAQSAKTESAINSSPDNILVLEVLQNLILVISYQSLNKIGTDHRSQISNKSNMFMN